MRLRLKAVLLLAVVACSLTSVAWAEEALPPIPPIQRVLPPEGVKLPADVEAKLRERVTAIEKRLKPLTEKEKTEPYAPDIEVFTKAVRFALDLHEFYDAKKDVDKANKLLDEAERRLAELEKGKHTWTTAGRLVVRGYRSSIDNSAQPYGVVFPKDFDPKSKKKYPLYVWLHGRGDKSTDLHFINERMSQVGQLGEVDAIVIHPFGRQCVGFKSAGELDVLDTQAHFWRENKQILNDWRAVLIGFSMGGAGAWHVGAHYANRYDAVCPGAGFAETAKYTKTDPAKVPWYERKLWGAYDVPCYTRNLFNTEVIAYSGENDKQIQAARVMEEAFKAEGRELTHLIGPGVEHKYEPKTLEELKRRLEAITSRKQERPSRTSLQTQTLRYGYMHGFELLGLGQHWQDTRLDAERTGEGNDGSYTVKTKNVTAFRLRGDSPVRSLTLDGQQLALGQASPSGGDYRFEKADGQWRVVDRLTAGLLKRPRLQGPIDDAFLESFVFVKPTGRSKSSLVQRWVDFEIQHFVDRWKALMRGEIRVKNDTDITDEDIQSANLICFGDPDSNAVIRRTYQTLPVSWKNGKVVAGEQSWSSENHLPVAIYPNPLDKQPKARNSGDAEQNYIVINSGLTFREAHDRTNSQQNPKLPDWAVIDLSQLPDDKSPGRIAAAGFFDEEWKYQEPQE
jgi:hypothetical protein